MSLQVGDRVAYSVQWLKSTGQCHTDIAHAKGRITSFEDLGRGTIRLAVIEWEGDTSAFPAKVNVANLAKVGPNPRYCQC